jgi:hypothetical protein
MRYKWNSYSRKVVFSRVGANIADYDSSDVRRLLSDCSARLLIRCHLLSLSRSWEALACVLELSYFPQAWGTFFRGLCFARHLDVIPVTNRNYAPIAKLNRPIKAFRRPSMSLNFPSFKDTALVESGH